MSDQSVLPEGAAPPTAADGAVPSPGDAPAVGAGPVATDDAAALERVASKKNAASYRKGKAEGQSELLQTLGVTSAEEVQRILDVHRATEDEADVASTEAQAADERSAIRTLRSDLRARDRALEETGARLTRISALNERARRTELHNRLVSAGAHPDAVGDLVSLLHSRVEWSDEGDGLEVVDRDGDTTVPSGMTLDELITEQKDARSYMFVAVSGRGGGGTQVRATAVPGNGVPARAETWQDRVAKARAGR